MNKYQHRLDILAALFAIRDFTHKRNILSLANGPVKQSEKRPITVNVGAKPQLELTTNTKKASLLLGSIGSSGQGGVPHYMQVVGTNPVDFYNLLRLIIPWRLAK